MTAKDNQISDYLKKKKTMAFRPAGMSDSSSDEFIDNDIVSSAYSNKVCFYQQILNSLLL